MSTTHTCRGTIVNKVTLDADGMGVWYIETERNEEAIANVIYCPYCGDDITKRPLL